MWKNKTTRVGMRNDIFKIIINRAVCIIASVVLLCLIPAIPVSAAENTPFWIEYIDVGQGDCALICCDDHYMMIDGGPPSASSIVYTILKNKGITKLDAIIATHPDADHIGGLSGALNYAETGKCYSPVTEHDTKTFHSLEKYLNKQNVTFTVPTAGNRFYIGSAKVTILGPLREGDESNNNSIAVDIKYGSKHFLFTGDAELEEENDIVSTWKDLNCDVLKVGHHGSASSTSERFLRKVSPEYAVISVGENSYGHPVQSTLDSLVAAKTEIYRTDLQGDITVYSDGKNIYVETEKTTTQNVAENAPVKEEALQKNVQPDNVQPDNVQSNNVQSNNTQSDQVQSDLTKGSYVLNTNTKKFHYPSCGSVSDMKPKNRKDVTETREAIIAAGYVPCKRCNP